MTTLRHRPESGEDSAAQDAHCPHCGSVMASGVELPWPEEPVLCEGCSRWVGRARSVAGHALPAAGGPEARAGEETLRPGRPRRERRGGRGASRPSPIERRRARELGPPPVPRFLSPDDPADETAPASDLGPDEAEGRNGDAAPLAPGAPDADGAPVPPAEAAGGNGAGPHVEEHRGALGEHGDAHDEAEPVAAANDGDAIEPIPPTDDRDPLAVGAQDGARPEPEHAPPATLDDEGARPVQTIPAGERGQTLPFWSVPSQPEKRRRFSLPRLRRPRLRRPTLAGLKRALPIILVVVGLLALVEGALIYFWKEPVSSFFTAQTQGALGSDLDELERKAGAEAAAARDRKAFNRLARRRSVTLNRDTAVTKPIGRLRIDKIDLNEVVVQGTDEGTSLTKGPGHYTQTPLPGQKGNWTVGIAGHRTTYGAPFRRINELKRGDEIVFALPYGKFTYEVEGTKIVDDSATDVFVPKGYDRIALTACHPLYSDAQRIIAYGRLSKSEPRA